MNCSGCATELQSAPEIEKLTKAGFWIRALARIVDILVAVCVGFIAVKIAVVAMVLLDHAGRLPDGWQNQIQGFSLGLVTCSFLGSILYHFFCEGIHGATLGKLCCGICVVSEDGKPSTMKGAMVRTLAYYIDSIFFGGVAYTSMDKSPLNQRYGDKWGKTAVFKNNEIAPESRRTSGCLALALFLGLASWIFILALGMVLKVF